MQRSHSGRRSGRGAGNFSVRRVDDDGAAQLAANRQDAALIEELRRLVRNRQIVFPRVAARFDLARLFRRGDSLRQPIRPDERCAIESDPVSLKIGTAVVEARRLVRRESQHQQHEAHAGSIRAAQAFEFPIYMGVSRFRAISL